MRRWKKLLLTVVAVVFVAVLLLLTLAKVLITPERVRETIVPLVAESLHRDLALGAIEISLFSGIVLNDVVLNDRDRNQAFISVEKAVLRYRLLPLLLLKVEVDELSLERPQIQITRFENGAFNFSDMTGGETEGGGDKTGQSHGSKKSPVAIHVSEIAVSDGAVVFVDQTAMAGERQEVSKLNLTVRNFSTTEPFQLSLASDWNANAISLTGAFDLDDRSVDASLQFNDIRLKVKGDLLADVKGDRLRAELDLPFVEISKLVRSLPEKSVAIPTGLDLSGRLAAHGLLDGLVTEPKKLLRSGRVDFDAVAVRTNALHSGVNGVLTLEGLALKTERLLLTVNDQPLSLTGQIDDVSQQPLKADFTISSTRFDLDRIVPEEKQEAGAGSKAETATGAEELGPLDLPVNLTAAIQIKELLYRKLSVQDVDTHLTLKRNRLTVERMTATVAGGTVEPSAQVDLGVAGFNYTSQANLKRININPLVKAFKPELSDSLYGEVSGRFSLRGAGTDPAAIKRNLQGNGDFVLRQAKLTHVPALDSAARLLSVPELTDVVVDEGHLALKINQEIADLDLNTKGPEFALQTTGNATFSGQLGLRVNVSLSPRLSKKLDRRKVLGEVLTDKRGWSHVPLRVKGDYASPKVVLDTTAMAQQARQGAVEKLSERLKKRLDRSGDKSETTAEEDPAKKLIDNALKGLFGN